MFLRDRELRKPSGGGRRADDRARVLEEARQQRDARGLQKEKTEAALQLQRLLHGRLSARRSRAAWVSAFTQKASDIGKLKALLQLPAMPLPLEVLMELMRQLVFFYCPRTHDVSVAQLSGFFMDTITANTATAEQIKLQVQTQSWLFQRLLDIALHVNSYAGYTSENETAVLALQLIRGLCSLSPELQTYLLSYELRVLDAAKRVSLYSDLPQLSLLQLTRKKLLLLPMASDSCASMKESALMSLVMHLLKLPSCSSELFSSFLREILSVPLLHERVAIQELEILINTPELWESLATTASASLSLSDALPRSPVAGIPSVTWFLGNSLWLSNCVRPKTEALVVQEMKLLTRLLELVPLETYAAQGVAWTKVSESHSVPVVFPESLTSQLQLLLNDRYLRSMGDHLLLFDPSALRSPLGTERPAPMMPLAPTVAEQFGFGDIASGSSSVATSISSTWRKVKALGKSSWATSLLQKAGLRRDSDNDTSGASGLLNTSQSARSLAAQGSRRRMTLEKEENRSATERRAMKSGKAFVRDHVDAFATLCALFLSRWGRQKQMQSQAMRMLNTLAFYHVPLAKLQGQDSEPDTVSLVRFLWCVLQESKTFEDFARNVNLLRAQRSDAFLCCLALFCSAYDHLLVVLDDDEMYIQELPLPLYEIERLVRSLKHALYAAYWTHGNLTPAPETAASRNLEFGLFLVDTATQLMHTLYDRCSRQPFCNITSWVLPELDSQTLLNEALQGTPRANKLISSMPYLVPFPDRVKLFQRLVQADKIHHQREGGVVYRIRIRRGRVLEDGLNKLNVIGGQLKQRINVVFVNAAGREEMGIDAGGLFKEFWLDLSTLVFDLEYGLFLTTSAQQLLYPNPHSGSAHFRRETDHLTLFQFVGRVVGKALYEGVVLQPKFAHFFLAKLRNNGFNHLHDLPSLDAELYKNLRFLQSYDGDVQDLALTHTVTVDVFGQPQEIEIVPGGSNIPVTNTNRTRYVHLVANFYLNTQLQAQCAAFRRGLSDLIDPRWLQMFNEPELQVLISGKSGSIDVDDLRANTKYAGGYYAMDKRVAWLWKAVASLSPSEQASFLRFTTSCQRAPSLGFASLTPQFCVQKIPIRSDDELLPSSSTCFNTLKLPTYSSYKVLRAKLLTSISSGAGFEMS